MGAPIILAAMKYSRSLYVPFLPVGVYPVGLCHYTRKNCPEKTHNLSHASFHDMSEFPVILHNHSFSTLHYLHEKHDSRHCINMITDFGKTCFPSGTLDIAE